MCDGASVDNNWSTEEKEEKKTTKSSASVDMSILISIKSLSLPDFYQIFAFECNETKVGLLCEKGNSSRKRMKSAKFRTQFD